MNVNIKWKFLDFVLSTTSATAQRGRWENSSLEAKEFCGSNIGLLFQLTKNDLILVDPLQLLWAFNKIFIDVAIENL